MLLKKKIRYCFACGILMLLNPVHAQNDQGFFRYQEEESPTPPKQAIKVPPMSLVLSGNQQPLVIHNKKNGQFYTSGKIKNVSTGFNIDTGISKFVMSESRARFHSLRNCTPKVVGTANGYVNGCEALIPEMHMGHFKLLNVPVLILKGLERDAIIGMDILRHFDVRTDNNKMTIAIKNTLPAQQPQHYVRQNNTQPVQRQQPAQVSQREYTRPQAVDPFVQTDRRIVSLKEDIKFDQSITAAEIKFDNFLKKTLTIIYVDRYLILKIIIGLILLRIFMGILVAYIEQKERKDRNYPY